MVEAGALGRPKFKDVSGGIDLYPSGLGVLRQFRGESLVSTMQCSRDNLDVIYDTYRSMKDRYDSRCIVPSLRGLRTALIFTEGSHRTHSAFHIGIENLGGFVYSPVKEKDECIEHLVRVMAGRAHLVVLRDAEDGAALKVLPYIRDDRGEGKPLISGGDGKREHPFQAVLEHCADLDRFCDIRGLTVTLVGDLLNSRVAHSLAPIYALYDMRVNLVSHESFGAPFEMAEVLNNGRCSVFEYPSLQALEEDMGEYYVGDVIMPFRPQLERIADQDARWQMLDYYKKNLTLTCEFVDRHPELDVRSPMPIMDEIDRRLDFHMQSQYFQVADMAPFVAGALSSLMLRGS